MAIIYKITNRINDKMYIGETIRDLKTRWREHVSEAFNEGHGYYYHLHCAIRKYGVNNFTIKAIDTCNDNERFEVEAYYISLYNTYIPDNGYNHDPKSEGYYKVSTEDIMREWNKGKGIIDISRSLSCHRGTISQRLRNNGITLEDIKKRASINSSLRQGLPIEQYTLEGEYIKTWPSASECQRQTGYIQTAISSVSRLEQYMAYGYLWKLADDPMPIEIWVERNKNKGIGGRKQKSIIQIDKNTNKVIKVYNSAAEAARALGLNDKSKICRAARNNGSSAGYKWIYKEGEDINE